MVTPSSQGPSTSGWADSQAFAAFGGIGAVVQDRAHDLVFHRERELEVLQQLARIGAFGDETGPGVGRDFGAAQIGAEPVVAALQIGHLEVGRIHRVRFPAQKDHRLAALIGAGDLRQHALFRGFDHFERGEAEGIGGDHVEDQAVAVIARLDAVDGGRPAHRPACRDVGEIADPQRGPGGVGGQRVLGADQVGADRLDRARIAVGGDVSLHRRHPVAQEHVDIALAAIEE